MSALFIIYKKEHVLLFSVNISGYIKVDASLWDRQVEDA